jgi:hypothetical protein
MGAGKVQSLAIIERARQRAGTPGDEAVAAIISEAVRAARAAAKSCA